MPIQVNTKKLTARHNDLPDQIKVDMLNEMVEAYAREAKEELGTLKCKKHPLETSYITVIADRKHTTIIKKKFCPDFEQKISIKLERREFELEIISARVTKPSVDTVAPQGSSVPASGGSSGAEC